MSSTSYREFQEALEGRDLEYGLPIIYAWIENHFPKESLLYKNSLLAVAIHQLGSCTDNQILTAAKTQADSQSTTETVQQVDAIWLQQNRWFLLFKALRFNGSALRTPVIVCFCSLSWYLVPVGIYASAVAGGGAVVIVMRILAMIFLTIIDSYLARVIQIGVVMAVGYYLNRVTPKAPKLRTNVGLPRSKIKIGSSTVHLRDEEKETAARDRNSFLIQLSEETTKVLERLESFPDGDNRRVMIPGVKRRLKEYDDQVEMSSVFGSSVQSNLNRQGRLF